MADGGDRSLIYQIFAHLRILSRYVHQVHHLHPFTSDSFSMASISEQEILAQQITTPIIKINYLQLFRYATKKDWFIIGVSFLAATIAGAITTMPALLTGLLIGSIQASWSGGPSQDRSNSELTRFTIYFVYLFLGEIVSCYIANIGFIRTGIILSSRIRERYLAALLSQNIAFFDNIGAGEISTRITADANLIRDGISEKVSVAVQCSASVVAAFVINFMRDWRLTLILASSLICIALVFAAAGIMLTKYRQQWLGERPQNLVPLSKRSFPPSERSWGSMRNLSLWLDTMAL